MLKTKLVQGEPWEKIEQVLSTIIILRLVIKILAQANAHQKNHARWKKENDFMPQKITHSLSPPSATVKNLLSMHPWCLFLNALFFDNTRFQVNYQWPSQLYPVSKTLVKPQLLSIPKTTRRRKADSSLTQTSWQNSVQITAISEDDAWTANVAATAAMVQVTVRSIKENLQSCKDCNLKACVTWGNVLADLQVCMAEVSGKVTWAVTYRKLGYVLKKYVYVSVVLVSVTVCAFLILNRFEKYRITKNDINLLSKENE